MKHKLTTLLLLISLLAVCSALWQAWQAAHLEQELSAIDRKTQAARLLELSLPRVQAEMGRLLEIERNKLGNNPPVGKYGYPMPPGGKADFNCGFFMLAPAGEVQAPAGEEGFADVLNRAPILTNAIRRKAYNPSAPIIDPEDTPKFDRRTHLPVFGVYEVIETDIDKPMRQTGKPGYFFAWNYKDNLVYMRAIPTTHGQLAEGFIIDATKLAEHLLPLVEPGLGNPRIDFAGPHEAPNLSPLPLVLRPGEQVSLADTAERRVALRGTVITAWLTSILTLFIITGLLVFYWRQEKKRADFVSAVTHELRTPLTTFQLCTEMLQSGELSPEKTAEYLDTLRRESLRLGHLVENVLSYSRLTRGKVRGQQDSGPCAKLLSPIFEKIAEHLRAAGFNVTINIDPHITLLHLRTDLLTIEQILLNLADNTIKYTESERPTASIFALQTHRTLSIRFTDNGIGIPAEQQRRLFQPFSRSARAISEQKPGIGLGLALSRDLARSIGGNLALERTSPQGTTFLLTLPLGE